MIVSVPNEAKTRRLFQKKLKGYLTVGDPKSFTVKPKRGSKTMTLGELVSIPESDIHHVFNNEAMLAISHAIEDLAGEIREGELISTFQKLQNFAPQKKRYLSLARDLDAVRVWGQGEPPKGCARIDFVPTFHPDVNRYWMVLFASDEASAVLVCKQANKATEFSKKLFVGFYSFNPFLVQSIRRRFNLMSCGLDRVIDHWEKESHFPGMSLSDLNRYFAPNGS
jgi:hypothetical protein